MARSRVECLREVCGNRFRETQMRVDGYLVGPPNLVPAIGLVVTAMRPVVRDEIWAASAMEYAGTFLQAARSARDPILRADGLKMAHALEYWMDENVSQGFRFEEPGGWEWNTPSVYRSPSFNQERTTLGVLNDIAPLVHWAVQSPPASEFPNGGALGGGVGTAWLTGPLGPSAAVAR